MSGIAGFADLNINAAAGADQRARLQAMCDAIRHRGTLTNAYHPGLGVALGIRPSSESRPAHESAVSDDGHVHVVLDGDITNATEIQSELTSMGHRFPLSAANTIVHAYQAWGDSVFARLHGMFAVALWDGRARTLLLARDRAGLKPLYYGVAGHRLYWGSESKCLLTVPEIDRRLDAAALDYYLAYLLTPRDSSIVAGIKKLLPAHYLRLHDGALTLHRYWRLPIDEEFRGSEATAVEQTGELLGRSLQSHRRGDGSIGVLLSGGLNSSLVAAVLTMTSGPVMSVTVGFGQTDTEEVARAKHVATLLGTDHREILIQPDASAIVEQLIWHLDEPFGDPSAIPTWYLSQAASGLDVIVSGDGGDEMFGGCERYLPSPKAAAFDRAAGPLGRRLAGIACGVLPDTVRGKNFLRHVAQDPRGRYIDAMTFYQADRRAALLSADLRAAVPHGKTEARFGEPFQHVSQQPWTRQMMAFDFETDLPDDVLTKIDRAASAHGVSWRLPFLDDAVVEFAALLPSSMRVRNRELKPILKQFGLKHLPHDIVNGPKRGFGMTVDRWFGRPMREVFGDVLHSSVARQRGYFTQPVIERLLDDHLTGKQDHSVRLWQLLAFELWHRQCLDVPAMAA